MSRVLSLWLDLGADIIKMESKEKISTEARNTLLKQQNTLLLLHEQVGKVQIS